MTDIYKTFDHTADVGIEIYGEDLQQLFINAGYALFDLITDVHKIEATTSLSVTIEGTDQEDLMVRWLSELLSLHQLRGYLLSDFILHELGEKSLRATVKGERYESDRHELFKEIKAVTYHQLMVGKEKDRWVARIVFDI
jgi:SHS2 domain-containing protein